MTTSPARLCIQIERIRSSSNRRDRVIDEKHPARRAILASALAVSLTEPALWQVPSRRRLIADAAEAIVGVLPRGAATRLRSLDAWAQQPGNDAVCGEVEVDASEGQERCRADIRRPSVGKASDGARDAEIMRRCPIAVSTFRTDDQMTCAAHRPQSLCGMQRSVSLDESANGYNTG